MQLIHLEGLLNLFRTKMSQVPKTSERNEVEENLVSFSMLLQ